MNEEEIKKILDEFDFISLLKGGYNKSTFLQIFKHIMVCRLQFNFNINEKKELYKEYMNKGEAKYNFISTWKDIYKYCLKYNDKFILETLKINTYIIFDDLFWSYNNSSFRKDEDLNSNWVSKMILKYDIELYLNYLDIVLNYFEESRILYNNIEDEIKEREKLNLPKYKKIDDRLIFNNIFRADEDYDSIEKAYYYDRKLTTNELIKRWAEDYNYYTDDDLIKVTKI